MNWTTEINKSVQVTLDETEKGGKNTNKRRDNIKAKSRGVENINNKGRNQSKNTKGGQSARGKDERNQSNARNIQGLNQTGVNLNTKRVKSFINRSVWPSGKWEMSVGRIRT